MSYITFQPSDYFNTKLYTGTGSSNSLTGVGFQPDLVWIKRRSAISSNQLFDAVRGVTKRVFSDSNEAESTDATTLTSFDSDGFTVSTHTGLNNSSDTYASWNWLANGSGSANTDGTINTTYTSANTTSGVSIIQYTGNSTSGATIGHGLGVEPSVYFCKKTNSSGDNWGFYHKSLGATKYLLLNTNDSGLTSSAPWNDTAPTSSVITLGNATAVNGNTDTFIGYAFAEKKGFSKFGSYVGNGSTDGTFVYTGFKPAFIIVKQSSASGESWKMWDTKRSTFNITDKWLEPDDNQAEGSGSNGIDILSNGFKCKQTNTAMNASGATYIYMAFASEPLVSSNDIPATAR